MKRRLCTLADSEEAAGREDQQHCQQPEVFLRRGHGRDRRDDANGTRVNGCDHHDQSTENMKPQTQLKLRHRRYRHQNGGGGVVIMATIVATVLLLLTCQLSNAYQPSLQEYDIMKWKPLDDTVDGVYEFQYSSDDIIQARMGNHRRLHFTVRNLKVEGTTTKKNKEKKTENKLSISSNTSSSVEGEACEPIEGTCQRCTFSEQKSYEACHATGRWMKYQCTSSSTTSPTSSSSSSSSSDDDHQQQNDGYRVEMRSCQYTQADEEFAMVRLQMICVLLGGLAIMSVKKNKRLSATLFDQRKQAAQAGANNTKGGVRSDKKRSGSFVTENDEQIEFTPMMNQQQRQQELEMAPLVESNHDSRDTLMSVNSYDELEVV